MPQITLSSLGFSIVVKSKRKEQLDYIIQNKALFESIVVELKLGAATRKPDFVLSIEEVHGNQKLCINLASKEAKLGSKLFDLLTQKNSTFDFVFLIIVIFEYLYEKSNVYGLWCAGFAKKRNAYLLFANSNGGKSNIVTRLSHESGYSIIGDDRIALKIINSKVYSIGGNKMLSFRSGAVPGYLASKPDFIRDKKLRARPEQIGASKFKGNAPLSSIFIVSISEKNGFTELPQGDVVRYAYSNISRVIGATEFSFMDSSCGFPYIDSQDLRSGRFKFVSYLHKIKTYEVHGSVDYIVQKIAEIAKN